MKLPVTQHISRLKPYTPGKPLDEAKRELGLSELIKLASNENPLGPSPKAIEAVRNKLSENHLYPDPGAFSLKQKLSELKNIAAQEIIVGNGSNEVFELIIRTFCQPGDKVVSSEAAFVAFRISAQAHSVDCIETPLLDQGRFDLKKMARTVLETPGVKLIYLPIPNNPTGTYVTDSELQEFIETVNAQKKEDCLILLDCAYLEYVTASDFPDPYALRKKHSNIVVLQTFSKIYGLAGFRIGFGVADQEVIQEMTKIKLPFNVNAMGQVAARAALDDLDYVKKSLDNNQKGMKKWTSFLAQEKIPFFESQGNFILLDAVQGFSMTPEQIYDASMKKGILFRPTAPFGMKDHLRISIGTDSENEKAMKVLRGLKEK